MLNILDELDTFESREQAIESSKEAGTCAEGAVGAGDEKNLDIKMRDAVKPPSKKPCHLQVEKTNLPQGITMFKLAQHV